MKVLCLLLSFLLLLSGCQTAKPTETELVPGNISDYTFSLPEGYLFETNQVNSLDILKDGNVIGGLVLTGLHISDLEDTGSTAVHKYIDSFGPMPLICEYMIMQGDEFLSISMAVTDPDTDIRTESFHHLFAHESRCFDLWFDSALSSDEDRDQIFDEILGAK